jgi:hypothetical protein
VPRLAARRVTLELDLVGTGSVVSLERPETFEAQMAMPPAKAAVGNRKKK